MAPDVGWSRRQFLGITGAAAGSAVLPLGAAERAFARSGRGFAIGVQRDPARDADWVDVIAAFDHGDRILMNTANLAPASEPARGALVAYTASIDADPSFQNRAQFRATRQATRERLAGYLRADPGEIAITRNTTEGNNFVVSGLALGPGDEIVLSAHNHPSNRGAWHTGAERYGYSVIEVDLASPPSGPEELLDDLRAATSRATRLISFSHVTNLGGCRYPAAAIGAWAREQGILTLIDGAQSGGALDVDLHAIGCDFYTASAHKWFCGPREAGVLYVRSGSEADLWPGIVGVGHAGAEGAARYETLGQRDDAAVAAFGYAVEFLDRIGSATVEARLAALTGYLKRELARLPGVRLYTPVDPTFSGGVVTFYIEGVDPGQAHSWMYQELRIASASSGVGDGGLRLSPHVYNSLAHCERAVDGVAELIAARA